MEILNLIVPLVILVVQIIVIAAGGQMNKYYDSLNAYHQVIEQNSFILTASVVSLVLAGLVAACHFVKTIPKKIHNIGRALLFGFQAALSVVIAIHVTSINKTPDVFKLTDTGKSYFNLMMASAVLLWVLCIPSIFYLVWPLINAEESNTAANTSSNELK